MKSGIVLLNVLGIPLLATLGVFFFAQAQTPPAAAPSQTEVNSAITIESYFSPKDWEPNADPDSPEWAKISGVQASRDTFGDPVSLGPTEIRSRWTRKHLYLLFICPYQQLNLKPDPVLDQETDGLWNWDVAEAFIGADYLNPMKYKDFQVSPRGEFADLDVDREHPKLQKGLEWNSGMTVKGRIDEKKKVWYGEMQIPFAALDVKAPKVGVEMRIGLFRSAGSDLKRIMISWRETGGRTFHVPEAFGNLILEKENAPAVKDSEKDKEKPKEVKEKPSF